ncbi:MAG: tetratricopeptide repeat protein, partial [Bacteroidia bacterium]|nr:tetratricopeptide repeat protein [Bacteroidia bacterium]
KKNLNNTKYKIQINKVANAIKEVITAIEQHNPEQEQISKEVSKPISVPKKNHKTTIIAGSIIVLALIILGLIFVPKLFKPPEQIEKSIAVLPFINDSPEASRENTPFVNGLMEEILINLQTIKEFRVPGRTSVEQYRDNTDKSIPEIARELDVNYIVEGSVQKYGNRFRLRVQLIRAKGKEAHLWAKSYEQEIKGTNDIFNIQSQIAQAIAAELKTVISPEEKQLIEKTTTTNLSAYDFYQRGQEEATTNYLFNNYDQEALTRAEKFYRQAIKFDPDYAQAFIGLAMTYWNKHYDEEYFSRNFLDSVLIFINTALSYDNKLAEAHSLKGDYYRVNTNYEEALKEYKKTLEINPNYWQAYSGLAELYFYQTREPLKGFENVQMAVKLNHDPKQRPELLYASSWAYDHMGFYDKTISICNEALKLNGDSIEYFERLASIENRYENYLNAIKFLEKCHALDSNKHYYNDLGNYYMKLGQKKTAVEYYNKYITELDTILTIGVNDRHRVG